MSHGTLSNDFPGWYVTFQTDVLSQLPRPGELSEKVADGWHGNRESMKKVLSEALCPSSDDPSVEAAPAPKPEPQPLLISVGTATVAATTVPFTVREFVERIKRNAPRNKPVKITFGDNFSSWFLDKPEQPFGGSTLACGNLSRYSVDGQIITELGGAIPARTSLTEAFALWENQKYGESGKLLTNSYAIIFYVEDEIRLPEDEQVAYTNEAGEKVVLRAVYFYWDSDGRYWYVEAYSVLNQDGWDGGFQVFSRDSRVSSVA